MTNFYQWIPCYHWKTYSDAYISLAGLKPLAQTAVQAKDINTIH